MARCLVCGELSEGEDELIEHVSVMHSGEDSSTSYSCPFCCESYMSEVQLSSHVNQQHIESPVKGVASGSSTSPPSTSHSSMHDPEPNAASVKCPLCGVVLGVQEVDRHMASFHLEVVGDSAHTSTSHPQTTCEEQHPCPMCNLKSTDLVQLEIHVNSHFTDPSDDTQASSDSQLAQLLERRDRIERQQKEEVEFEKLKEKYGMSESGSYSTQGGRELMQQVGRGRVTPVEYHHLRCEMLMEECGGCDSLLTRTRGVMERLRAFSSHPSNSARDTWLCTGPVDHYASGPGDRGWGCGYRNTQILLSSLSHIQHYRQMLFSDKDVMFSIRKIQQLIEGAWAAGFDAASRDQLGGKLVGTRKWVGTMELMVLLHHHKVRAEIYEFHEAGADKTHPQMFEWILQYFQSGGGYLSPLYMQHQGHSRCVVGVERCKRGVGVRVLVFDPSCKQQGVRSLSIEPMTNMKLTLVRRNLSAFTKDKYQLLCVREQPLPSNMQPDNVFAFVKRIT